MNAPQFGVKVLAAWTSPTGVRMTLERTIYRTPYTEWEEGRLYIMNKDGAFWAELGSFPTKRMYRVGDEAWSRETNVRMWDRFTHLCRQAKASGTHIPDEPMCADCHNDAILDRNIDHASRPNTLTDEEIDFLAGDPQ